MYEEFYGLSEKPFNLTPDPKYFYLGSRHREALDFLSSEIKKKGTDLVVLTGEVGAGKTAVLRSFVKDLGPSYELIQVFYPTSDCAQLLQMILLNMGHKSVQGDLHLMREELDNHLKGLCRTKKNLLLLVDEAQHLGVEALRETFRLSELKVKGQNVLKVILSGLPDLRKKVSSIRDAPPRDEVPADTDLQGDAAVFQEIHNKVSSLYQTGLIHDIKTYHLTCLPAGEVPEYIRYRLKVAGRPDSGIFTDEEINSIGQYAGGTPRLINMICDAVLMQGCLAKEKTISISTLQEVIDNQFSDILAEGKTMFGMRGNKSSSDETEPGPLQGAEAAGSNEPDAGNEHIAYYIPLPLHVLVMEKNARMRMHLENAFQKYGYNATSLKGIDDLFEMLDRSGTLELSVLVADATFFFTEGGREDEIGKSALDRLSATHAYLPLIMTSALPLSAVRARLLSMGIPYLIQKPDLGRLSLSEITAQFNNFFDELRASLGNIHYQLSQFYFRMVKLTHVYTDLRQ